MARGRPGTRQKFETRWEYKFLPGRIVDVRWDKSKPFPKMELSGMVMPSVVHVPIPFLTDEEFREIYPERSVINQSMPFEPWEFHPVNPDV